MAQFAKKHQPSYFGVSVLVNSYTTPSDIYLLRLLLRHNAEEYQQSIKHINFIDFEMPMPIQNIREAQHSRWERWQCRRSLQSQPPQAGTLSLSARGCSGCSSVPLFVHLSTHLSREKTGDEERKDGPPTNGCLLHWNLFSVRYLQNIYCEGRWKYHDHDQTLVRIKPAWPLIASLN